MPVSRRSDGNVYAYIFAFPSFAPILLAHRWTKSQFVIGIMSIQNPENSLVFIAPTAQREVITVVTGVFQISISGHRLDSS